MKQVLETIIRNIVEDQNSVSINEKEEADKITYEVKVAGSDMGRVIGKQGKVANSIRSVMRALGSKNKKKVVVEFLD